MESGESQSPIDRGKGAYKIGSGIIKPQDIQRSKAMEITLSLPTQQFMLDSPAQLAQKIKLYAAVAMYQTGELSIGAACEVANVDRYWFNDFLNQHSIPLQLQTPDELEAEFHTLINQ
jgi:predicted HTH domain antitoxin